MDLEKYMPKSSKSEQSNQTYEDFKFDLEEYKRQMDEENDDVKKEQTVKPNIEGKGYGYMNSKYIVKNVNMEENDSKQKEEVKVEIQEVKVDEVKVEIKPEAIVEKVTKMETTSKEKMLEERIKQLELELLKKELSQLKEETNVEKPKQDVKQEIIEDELEITEETDNFDMEIFEQQMNGFTGNEVVNDYDLEKNIENEMLEELANDLESIKKDDTLSNKEELMEEKVPEKIEQLAEKQEDNIDEILEQLENVTFDDEIEEDLDFTITGSFEEELEEIKLLVEDNIEKESEQIKLEITEISKLEETLKNIENNNVYIKEKTEGFDFDNYLPGSSMSKSMEEYVDEIEEAEESNVEISLEELAKLESMNFGNQEQIEEYIQEEPLSIKEEVEEEIFNTEPPTSEERKNILDKLYQTKPIEFVDNDEIIKKFDNVELKKDKEEIYKHVDDNQEECFDLEQFLNKMSNVKECEINKYHENDIKKEVKHLTVEDFKHEMQEEIENTLEKKEENEEEAKESNSFDMSRFLPGSNNDEF